MHRKIQIKTFGQALYEITGEITDIVASADVDNGLCNIFLQHTSASLLIQENADPSAKYDLEQWIKRFIPENDPNFTHTCEGPDDMPAHIKAAISQVNLTIPIIEGTLALGRWQGIYLWEHRSHKHLRSVIVSCFG
jgi:secondary thiamine-phosphate synthase enzyme